MDRAFPADDGSSRQIEASTSAVSWPAIIAGAFIAVSVSLILLALGSGLGLTSVSPWPNNGASITTFTVATAIWLIVMQWIASAVGGYLTGRLRTKWVGVHTHEVFFRDTAHGFLTWAVATVISAIVVASAASAVVSAGSRAATAAVSGAAQGAGQRAGGTAGSALPGSSAVGAYDVDTLFRSDRPDANSSTADARAESMRILVNGLATGDVPTTDRDYLAQLVAARAGISETDAQKRVDGTIARVKAAEVKARQAADAGRKATAAFAFFTALSMLIGAFIACVAAALGGQQRDKHSLAPVS